MTINPSPETAAWLAARGVASPLDLDPEHLERHRRDVRIHHPDLSEESREALAIYATLHHPNSPHNLKKIAGPEPSAEVAAAAPSSAPAPRSRPAIAPWVQIAILLAILLTLLSGRAHAQPVVAPITTASTGGSASTSYITSAASTNATSVKASAGNVYSIRVINTTATIYYLRLYNLATAPTCSSATGFVETIPIPASSTGAGLAITQYPQGYSTGIAYCLTGGGSSTDNTSAATGLYVTVLYK